MTEKKKTGAEAATSAHPSKPGPDRPAAKKPAADNAAKKPTKSGSGQAPRHSSGQAKAAAPEKTLKVFEAAKELKMSADALLGMFKELGFPVKSRMSAVEPAMIVAVKQKFEEEKQAVKKEQEQQKKIQEKKEAHAKAEAKAVEIQPVPLVVAKVEYPPELTMPYPSIPATVTTVPEVAREELEDRGVKKKRKRKKRKKEKRPAIDQTAIAATVRQTMAAIERGKARRPRRAKDRDEAVEEAEEQKVIRLPEYSSVADLAQALDVKPGEVIAKALGLGMMVTINQRLDLDTLATIADEFGYGLEEMEEFAPEEEEAAVQEPARLEQRPPVVTVMGHVDHGKTTLLDSIRKTNVAGGEHGGITQHIGAYEVKVGGQRITFLDTPGHEAFTAMRARGAQVTDLVILVVAASEGIMPQTVEAIDHAQAAKVPVIVAVNKCDLPGADPMRVKQELTKHNLLVEEWGGKTISVELSAKTGAGIDKLLEMILLQSELLELKADPHGPARGTVIESRLDRGKGVLATVLVQQGTLNKGQPFVAGLYSGRVRAMYDERGRQVDSAGPSTAVEVQGFEGAPLAGESFQAMESESAARELAGKRQQLKREQDFRPAKSVTLEGLYDQIQEGQAKELKLIIKGDVGGSVEALSDSVFKMSTDQLRLTVIHKGVGAITESDVLLAKASGAIIIGFHVRPEERARELAERENVDIRMYSIIYEALEELKKAQKGLLAPEFKEVVQARVEVREIFKISAIGTIAGCLVQSGTIARSHKVRLLRDSVVIYTGKLASLKRFKDDVREVQNGFECGMSLEQFNDIKVGDVIESYTVEEIKRED
jgi:translation initiation factor IF-2